MHKLKIFLLSSVGCIAQCVMIKYKHIIGMRKPIWEKERRYYIMKLNKTMKKFLAYLCALAMIVTSITGWQSETKAADWVDITGDVGTSTWAYKTVESTMPGSQTPIVYGSGNYVKFVYSADNTDVTVKVNGEDGTAMIFEQATGMTTLKFDVVADNTYTAVEIRSAQGVMKTIVKKGTPEGEEPTFAEEPKVEAPEGYTLLDTEAWHPMGEIIENARVGDNGGEPASSWNIYTGNEWANVSAAAKDGANDQDTVSVYVLKAATGEWGLQLGKVFSGLEEDKNYVYTINYTIDGVADIWEGNAKADANGHVIIVKALGNIVSAGSTFTVTSSTIGEPDTSTQEEYVTKLTTEENLAYQKTALGSSWKEGNGSATDPQWNVLTDADWNKWSGNYIGIQIGRAHV